MQTSLRRMGNSVGMIVPRSALTQIGATTGTRFDLEVRDGKLVASPVEASVREGWALAAAAIADDDAPEWRAPGNEADADWTW
ncbi:hypothetical protein [Sphingomonas sp. 1P08PE]|uniref:AbrB/MazE/SpoVT family DNA-binding domain-containing protein n=1 Tax=Sphingomonas sp. 1P08PE TaxID=554122 RepID=UPI0039A0C8C6